MFWIVFKEYTLKTQFEIIVIFKEISDRKKDIMNDFTNKNEWVKEIGFNLFSDLEKEIDLYGCKIIIVNKTLKFKQKEKNNNNILSPNILNKRTGVLNLNKTISNECFDEIQKQTYVNLKKFELTMVGKKSDINKFTEISIQQNIIKDDSSNKNKDNKSNIDNNEICSNPQININKNCNIKRNK